jgi:hypothetical protein
MVQGDARWVLGRLLEGRDVIAFYNNDIAGHAVENTRLLQELVSRGSGDSESSRMQRA